MKQISFFSVIKSFIYTFSLLITIFVTSFILVSLFQFNHKKNEINYQNIEIYNKEDIEEFNSYFDDNLYIILKMKEEKNDEYFINYAHHYFSLYKTLIYLEVDNISSIKYINVDNKGITTII